jgi:hypothetical protein
MTFNEIIYRIKEALKVNSDDLDFDYSDELIANHINSTRALLLYQRYKDGKKPLPDDFYQKVEVDLALVDKNANVCIGVELRSTTSLPNLADINGEYKIKIYKQGNNFVNNINYVQPYRYNYTGYNPLVINQYYVTIDAENYLYLRSDNSMYKIIEELEIFAVLDNPINAGTSSCDPYEDEYPMSEGITQEVIDMVVANISKTLNLVGDKENNSDETNRA